MNNNDFQKLKKENEKDDSLIINEDLFEQKDLESDDDQIILNEQNDKINNADKIFFIIVLIILGLAIVLPDMFYKISTNLGENTELTKEKVKKHQNDNENLDRCVSFHYRSGK